GMTAPDGAESGKGGVEGLGWLQWHLAIDGRALAAAAVGQLEYGASLAHEKNCLE
ncbi:unnamed protein product, partial [Prorocentrum cordatum]